MKIAFVHDWLTTYAGAETVLEAALELFPGAPVYTLLYRPEAFQNTRISEHPVTTSFIERLPKSQTGYRNYLALMPLAVEQFDLGESEVVFSSSHAVAKGVLTRADQLHISYIHTPIRYAWDLYFQYLKTSNLERGLKSWLARLVLHYLRLWDAASAHRVDLYVANSRYVARRIAKVYRRKARVIYPPVDVDRFRPKIQREDCYLTVSRFVPYKRVDLIVQAFSELGRPLVVIGDGPERPKIERLAAPNVRLLGYQPDAVVKDYMERCKAFVFAAEEDFGITPVEAQAAGAPVIAYGKGGVVETVLPGRTGILFHEQTVPALKQAVKDFEAQKDRFSIEALRENALRFSKPRFQREVQELIDRAWQAFQKNEMLE